MKGTEFRPLAVLVLEDEWPTRNYLVELVHSTGAGHVVAAVGSVDEANAVLNSAAVEVDVAFVDVELHDRGGVRSGIDFIRSRDPRASGLAFVLATAFDRYAVEAFELGAVDYLLKPFSEDRVAKALHRARERRSLRTECSEPPRVCRIAARRSKSLVFLDPDEIWAFEAADRLTYVHTPHGCFDIDLSLAALEASVPRSTIRVHRNWLVTARHIRQFERDGNDSRLLVGAGFSEPTRAISVPVSRDKAQAIRDLLLADSLGLRSRQPEPAS